MKKTTALKTALFLTIFVIVLSFLYRALLAPESEINYHCVNGFYKEKKGALDAVYIGSSTVQAYWIAPMAWHENGITVYPYATGSQPLQAALSIIKDARKTQPDALYLVNIYGIFDSLSPTVIHRITTYSPLSFNRFNTIKVLCDVNNAPFQDRLEFYFPLYRFHSRWKDLKIKDFYYRYDGLKGILQSHNFLAVSKNVSSNFQTTKRRGVLSGGSLQKSLKELLDYCDVSDVRVLFVASSCLITDVGYWAKINTISDYVQSRGYPCLNLLDHIEEIGLDLTTDYYDGNHTNVHGALKTTKFLTDYLVKNYGFKDKRGEAEYSDWDSAYDKYMKVITPYVLDIETNFEKRDYTLPAPKLNKINVDGTSLTVKWDASEGAEGYRIYRKEGKSSWQPIGEADGDALQFTDKSCKKDTTYTYTVVPWHVEDGEKAWGRFDIKGVEAKSLLDAPHLTSLEKTDDGVKIAWEKVEDAAGYKIFRRLPERSWTMLKDVGNTNSYVDTAVLENLPFCYTVKSYSADSAEKKIDGSQDPEGLLYLPELTMPAVNVAENDGALTLSWESAEGMNGYRIYRNGELIAELPAWSKKFTDKKGTGADVYRVEAYFNAGSREYGFDLN